MTFYYTGEQRNNLWQLRDGWKEKGGLLSMKSFAYDLEEAKIATPDHPCKSSMCLVGSGPSMGITMTDREIRSSDFDGYSKRVFGLIGDAWDFAFGPSWPDSIPEAVARLTMVIEYRIPKEWVCEDRYVSEAGDE